MNNIKNKGYVNGFDKSEADINAECSTVVMRDEKIISKVGHSTIERDKDGISITLR